MYNSIPFFLLNRKKRGLKAVPPTGKPVGFPAENLMTQKSDVTGKTYQDEECVFFRNYLQAAKYISWGAKLIDIFTDSQEKLVFVFSKNDHCKYKVRWIERKKELGLE